MFDTEKFIKEVELRPIVYNTYNKDYYNKELKQKSWYEIGNAMFDDWDSLDDEEKFDTVVDLMKKWRFVRDAFVRNYKATVLYPKYNPNRKKYVFFDQLQFLLPITKGLQKDPMSADGSTDPSLCASDISVLIDDSSNINYSEDDDNNELSNSSAAAKKPRNIFPRKMSQTRSVLNRKSQTKLKISKDADKVKKGLLKKGLKRTKNEEVTDLYGHSSFLSSFVPVLCSMSLNEAMQVRQRISEIFSEQFSSQQGSK